MILVAVVHQNPFAERPPGRGEGFATARGDEFRDALAGEFDDEVAGRKGSQASDIFRCSVQPCPAGSTWFGGFRLGVFSTASSTTPKTAGKGAQAWKLTGSSLLH
ncbi:hypothetical protein SSP24_10990 [Streptomyces spinoverrucosus]|uniref:Uncharacterized protein n=1 Tax=Streptomyces spinoverrucosus TaxID=284043 RepID=A0A4Y3V9B1_9ACTN|nr:hypothetical protein SSP24_10990 [Streptomyces spinoverrucosus]GHB35605.1 hypothetical protein GCM10010397_01580 [Streptomyces spinoverrucosus]